MVLAMVTKIQSFYLFLVTEEVWSESVALCGVLSYVLCVPRRIFHFCVLCCDFLILCHTPDDYSANEVSHILRTARTRTSLHRVNLKTRSGEYKTEINYVIKYVKICVMNLTISLTILKLRTTIRRWDMKLWNNSKRWLTTQMKRKAFSYIGCYH